MADPWKPQYENLFRGCVGGITLRTGDANDPDGDQDDDDTEVDGDGDTTAARTTLSGHFAVFNEWTEIDSWFEGTFVEQIRPGAFKRTINAKSDRKVCQFDHGYNELVGDNLLGPIDVLREDEIGPYYEVPLLDTAYNRDVVLPQCQGRLMDGSMRGSLVGGSFRFTVVRDSWVHDPEPSDYNPKALPERTILEVRLYEFGPVVFPAYPSATATASSGMRSLTDHYLDRMRSRRHADPASRHSAPVTPGTTPDPATGHSEVTHTLAAVRARLALAFA